MISLRQKNRNGFGETWSQSADHKKDAKWLQDWRSEVDAKKQKKIDITKLDKSQKEKRLEDLEEKVLHGQYLKQTKEVRSDQCWAWLQNGDLKRDRKSYSGSSESEYKNKSS